MFKPYPWRKSCSVWRVQGLCLFFVAILLECRRPWPAEYRKESSFLSRNLGLRRRWAYTSESPFPFLPPHEQHRQYMLACQVSRLDCHGGGGAEGGARGASDAASVRRVLVVALWWGGSGPVGESCRWRLRRPPGNKLRASGRQRRHHKPWDFTALKKQTHRSCSTKSLMRKRVVSRWHRSFVWWNYSEATAQEGWNRRLIESTMRISSADGI